MRKFIVKLFRVVSAVSFVILALQTAAYAVFGTRVKTSGIMYNDLEKETGEKYFTGAVIMSVPLEEENNFYDTPYLTFSQAQITLKEGESAYLQYTVRRERRQYDLQINYLYDAEIIQITTEKNRAKITAVKAGESTIQTFDNDRFSDIAYVKVIKGD
jgi:hypothetical protein